MAKIGNCEFPEIGLVESIELGQKIAREFAGEVSRQGLARSLGMSERGGAFSARLGALRMWGVAGGRSRVRVTRDGLRAVTPLSVKESEDARALLARNVSLFSEMASRIGEEPYESDRLAVLLEELSGADRMEVARRLPMIDRIFSEIRSYLTNNGVASTQKPLPNLGQQATQQQPEHFAFNKSSRFSPSAVSPSDLSEARPLQMGSAVPVGEQAQPVGDRIELGLPDGNLSLPETLANLDAALTVLWARRQLIAAVDAADGRPTPAPPRDFTRPSTCSE